MSLILSTISTLLPPPWHLSNLIHDTTWQANISDDEHVAIGTGSTPEEALTSAATKALSHDYIGKLFSLGRIEPSPYSSTLASALAFAFRPPPTQIKRRV